MQDSDPSFSPDPRSLRKLYGATFNNFNLHHMIPSSRKGKDSEFNLFPFLVKAHSAWHFIFLNLTIMEVWINFDSIHDSIFNTDEEMIKMVWLSDCKLESRSDPKMVGDFNRNIERLVTKGMSTERLMDKWFVCFGGADIHRARMVMKMMMLVMIFGHNISDRKELFDNGNISELIDRLPVDGPRAWAFRNCFHSHHAKPRRIKAVMSKILEAYPHY